MSGNNRIILGNIQILDMLWEDDEFPRASVGTAVSFELMIIEEMRQGRKKIQDRDAWLDMRLSDGDGSFGRVEFPHNIACSLKAAGAQFCGFVSSINGEGEILTVTVNISVNGEQVIGRGMPQHLRGLLRGWLSDVTGLGVFEQHVEAKSDSMEVEHSNSPSSPARVANDGDTSPTERQSKRIDTKKSPSKPTGVQGSSKTSGAGNVEPPNPIEDSSQLSDDGNRKLEVQPETHPNEQLYEDMSVERADTHAARVSMTPPEAKKRSLLWSVGACAIDKAKHAMNDGSDNALVRLAKQIASEGNFTGDWSNELDAGSFKLDSRGRPKGDGERKKSAIVDALHFAGSLSNGYLGRTQARNATIKEGFQEINEEVSNEFARMNVGGGEGEVASPSQAEKAAIMIEEARTTQQQHTKWSDKDKNDLRDSVVALFTNMGYPTEEVEKILFVVDHESAEEAQKSPEFKALSREFQQYIIAEFAKFDGKDEEEEYETDYEEEKEPLEEEELVEE